MIIFTEEVYRVENNTIIKKLSVLAFNGTDFEMTITNYECDICHKHSSRKNPIYTNDKNQGADICSECVRTAFKEIKPIKGLKPGPVYSLEGIYTLNERIKK